MSRVVRFRPRRASPADRELAETLVSKLIQAKDEAYRVGYGPPVEHDGRTIATLEVVDGVPDHLGICPRTVFVHLARDIRELVPIPWRG
jgi:hypothetical protein